MSFHSFLFLFYSFFKCFLVDVTKCDCLLEFWDTQGCVMGQWFLFGSIHFAQNHCHSLACAHSMPLVHVYTHAPKHLPFLLTISHPLNDVWFWVYVWCCNSTCTHTHCAFISVLLICPVLYVSNTIDHSHSCYARQYSTLLLVVNPLCIHLVPPRQNCELSDVTR